MKNPGFATKAIGFKTLMAASMQALIAASDLLILGVRFAAELQLNFNAQPERALDLRFKFKGRAWQMELVQFEGNT